MVWVEWFMLVWIAGAGVLLVVGLLALLWAILRRV
jgi:hypothetical protein